MGIKTNLIYKPWKRGELDIDNRGAVSFGWVRNKDRESKWLFSDKITVSSSFFLTRKDSNISWKTLDDLMGFEWCKLEKYNFTKFKNVELIGFT